MILVLFVASSVLLTMVVWRSFLGVPFPVQNGGMQKARPKNHSPATTTTDQGTNTSTPDGGVGEALPHKSADLQVRLNRLRCLCFASAGGSLRRRLGEMAVVCSDGDAATMQPVFYAKLMHPSHVGMLRSFAHH